MEAYRYELTSYSFKHASDSESHFRQKWDKLPAKDKAEYHNNVNRFLYSKVRGNATGSIKTHRDATVNNVLKELKKPLLEIQKEAKKELQLAKKEEYKSPAFAMRNEAPLRDLVDKFLTDSLGKSSNRDPKTKQYTYRGSEKIRAQHQDYFMESFGYAAPKDIDFRSIARALYRGTDIASLSAQQGLSQDEIDTILALHDTDPDLFRELAAQKFENLKSDNRRPAAVSLPDEIPRSAYTTNRGMDYINRFFANHDKRFGLTPSEATQPYTSATALPVPFTASGAATSSFNNYREWSAQPFTVYDSIRKIVEDSRKRASIIPPSRAVANPDYYMGGSMPNPLMVLPNGGEVIPSGYVPGGWRNITPPTKKDKEKDKSEDTIAKVLPLLVRPLINLVKSLGTIAGEASKAGDALAAMHSILGNPFEESTLAGISQWGATFGGMSGSFVSNVGGMLSSVGEGFGRMANNAALGDKADDTTAGTKPSGAGKGLGKGAAVVSAVTGIVGAYLSGVGQSISAGWGIATKLLSSINKATLKIMSTTPLFKTIKDILNLSFTMAFLPAMTLLQGKMLPKILDLLNITTKFGNKLAGIFTHVDENGNTIVGLLTRSFDEVFTKIGQFLNDNAESIANLVSGMIELLPQMMQMQLGLIELFVDNKDKILSLADKTIEALESFIDQGLFDAVLGLANITVDFIGKWGVPIAKAVIKLAEFFVGSFEGAMNTVDSFLNPTRSVGDFNKFMQTVQNPTQFVIDALVGGFNSVFHFASGGYVPATPGGVPAIIGEGGEGEYVIPESKLNSIGGLTIVFSGNVYGMNDFKQQVRSIMNEYTTKANFR